MTFDGPETESERLRRDVERLRHDIEWALRRALDPTDVLPMLHRLVRTAKAGTDESVFAYRQLAELIAPRHPWRAALYARRVLSLRPEDDRAWAVLAFAQTLLGHYRFAATAYSRALGCAPKNPWYAHNLGHLLDVALGRPEEALPWLASAYAAAKDHSELATSYAHALARSGDLPSAKRVLARAMRRAHGSGTSDASKMEPSSEQAALWRWLERGAPPPAASGSNKRTNTQTAFSPVGATEIDSLDEHESARSNAHEERPSKTRSREKSDPKASATCEMSPLEDLLGRGLDHLPLDARQRGRARSLARSLGRSLARSLRSISASSASGKDSIAATAGAIAYAIVDLDEVPLTQAEVAACFRVRVAALRARYDELRSELLLLSAEARTLEKLQKLERLTKPVRRRAAPVSAPPAAAPRTEASQAETGRGAQATATARARASARKVKK